MNESLVELPGSEMAFAPLGVGTWAWGDRSTWGMGGYDQDLNETSIREAWEASIERGVGLFDTAEVYGSGESERIIGRLLADTSDDDRSKVVLATKFWPAPWRRRVGAAMNRSLTASLDRLGVDKVDLYQIHGPISLRSATAIADGLAALVRSGRVSAVGVSNYSIRETRRMHAALARHSIPLASNQVEYSLLRTRPDTTGLLAACRELGVVVLAYSPLGQGRLTGKYSADSPPPGSRTFSAYPMDELKPLLAAVEAIAGECERTMAQVALRWIIQHGAVPIPGAKNAGQAQQNAGALGWALSDDQMKRLDAVAMGGQRSIRHRIWQHG